MLLEKLLNTKVSMSLFFVVWSSLLATCVSIDTFGGSCPCGDGWECCESENICVEQGSSCSENVESVEANLIVCQKSDVCFADTETIIQKPDCELGFAPVLEDNCYTGECTELWNCSDGQPDDLNLEFVCYPPTRCFDGLINSAVPNCDENKIPVYGDGCWNGTCAYKDQCSDSLPDVIYCTQIADCPHFGPINNPFRGFCRTDQVFTYDEEGCGLGCANEEDCTVGP